MASKDNEGWVYLFWGFVALGAFLKWIGYENLGNFLQHWGFLLTVVIGVAISIVIAAIYAIFWWLPVKALHTVTDDTPEALQRRERWKVAVYSGLGAGFGSLVFRGQLWTRNEETFFEFVVTALIIALASWMFFERISELVFAEYHSQPREQPADRRRPAVLIVATTLLITVLEMSVHSAVEAVKKGGEPAQLGLLVYLFVHLVTFVLCVGWITSSWVNGARQRPPRAAKKGAISGAIIGAVFSLVAALVFYKMGKLPIPEGLGTSAEQESGTGLLGFSIAQLLMWAGLGFAGGWAIDKRWGSRPTRGILIALAILSTVLAIFSYMVLHLAESFEDIFMAVGWAMGLVLHGDVSDRVLELGAGAVGGTEGQTSAIVPLPPRPTPKPWLWGALGLVLFLAVYIVWREEPKNREKVDSAGATPAPATRAPAVVAPSPLLGGKTVGDSPFGGGTTAPIGGTSLGTNTSISPEVKSLLTSEVTNISIEVKDSCNNGQKVYLRFFSDLGTQWPLDTANVYVLKYGDDIPYKLSCITNTQIRYGARDANDSTFWGAGIDGKEHCSDCDFKCTDDATRKMKDLTCSQQ